jgi:hypothetical protein
MPESVDAISVLRKRAGALERAARRSVALLGAPPLEVSADASNPDEPSVWIRNEVLVTFQVDGIVVGRISGNMTDVDEIGRFPAAAIIDAAKFAVMDTVSRAIGVQIERTVIETGGAS